MKRLKFLSLELILFSLMIILLPFKVWSYESTLVYYENKPLFDLRFYNQGEQFDPNDAISEGIATYNLNVELKNGIILGAQYWAEILGHKAANNIPIVLHIGTCDIANAYAYSPPKKNQPYEGYTLLQSAFLGYPDLDYNGQICIGKDFGLVDANQTDNLGWGIHSYTQIPLTGDQADLIGCMIHELGHALGISATTAEREEDYYFADVLTPWTEHLYDQYGNQAQPGMRIVYDKADYHAGDFLVEANYDEDYGVYGGIGKLNFYGEHVAEVLQGATVSINGLPGIPVNGWEEKPEFSHIQLNNCLMSHAAYCNYSTFMEAELAVLQDLGYDLDRRNFFGYSIYNSDLVDFINTNGYFARNSEGTAYFPGKYNTAMFGLGLHIYGSNNRITQAADILSAGTGGIGIRIDGQGNRLDIAKGIKVHANGNYGTGLLVSYGRNQEINLAGDLQALGSEGIASRFDFGSSSNGIRDEYRGSYIRLSGASNDDPQRSNLDLTALSNDSLSGPLVSSFNIQGSLTGSKAAVYISDNALVKEINLLDGAEVQGHIISAWNPTDSRIQYSGNRNDLVTDLNFSAANLRYDDDISGSQGLRFNVLRGTTSFNGTADVLSVDIADGAVLKGNGVYNLNEFSALEKAGVFSNNGSLAPGNSLGTIVINATYQQTDSGKLLMEFNNLGETDKIIFTQSPLLKGSFILNPLEGYYADNALKLNYSDFLKFSDGTSLSSALTADLSSAMLTLPTLQLVTLSDGSWSLARRQAAYSALAKTDDGLKIGIALNPIAGSLNNDLQKIVAGIDFGSLTVDQVGRQTQPRPYDSLLAATLARNQYFTRLTAENLDEAKRTGWSSFAKAITAQKYSAGWQDYDKYRDYFAGVLLGREKSQADYTLGFHLGLVEDKTKVYSASLLKGNTTAGFLGIHGAKNIGSELELYGVAKIGWDKVKAKRSISLNNYNKTNISRWTGENSNLELGLKYKEERKNSRFTYLAAINYGQSIRPGLEETGSELSLGLNKMSMQSLESILGVKAEFLHSKNNTRWSYDLSAYWHHEFLDQGEDYSWRILQQEFKQPWQGKASRERLVLNAGGTLYHENNFSAAANIGTEIGESGYHNWFGGINCTWQF